MTYEPTTRIERIAAMALAPPLAATCRLTISSTDKAGGSAAPATTAPDKIRPTATTLERTIPTSTLWKKYAANTFRVAPTASESLDVGTAGERAEGVEVTRLVAGGEVADPEGELDIRE